jgi:hypothetical protein
MLSEYIARRVAEIHEKTYHRLVVALAVTSMTSVMFSGIALFFNTAYKYIALAVLALGIMVSKRILRAGERKIRKILTHFDRELLAQRYTAVLKDRYDPRDYITRIFTEPHIDDPVISGERKRLKAAQPLFAQGYTSLRTRNRLVILVTASSIILPHVLISQDIEIIIFTLVLVILSLEKRLV